VLVAVKQYGLALRYVAEEFKKDRMEWDYTDFPKINIFWSGTPCTLFSNASFKRDPVQGNILTQKTLDILEHFKKLNPKLIWFIENPWSSLLNKQEGFQDLPFTKVDYCQYATVPDFGYKNALSFGIICTHSKENCVQDQANV